MIKKFYPLLPKQLKTLANSKEMKSPPTNAIDLGTFLIPQRIHLYNALSVLKNQCFRLLLTDFRYYLSHLLLIC